MRGGAVLRSRECGRADLLVSCSGAGDDQFGGGGGGEAELGLQAHGERLQASSSLLDRSQPHQ